VVVLSFLRTLLRRVRRDASLLPLWEVLRRRGTRRLASGNPTALEFAVERCTACREADECRRLLAADWDAGIEAFCPNAMYFDHLGAMQRHARKPVRSA
jgi:hypothetical protein